VGPSVSAHTARGGADPGVLAGRGGSRDGIGGSTEWPIRAACPPGANCSHHHDARPFDRSRYDRDADDVSDLLSISGAYGVPCGFTVSFSLTGSIEGDGGCCSIRRTRAGPLSASAGSGRDWVPDRGFSSFAPLFTKVRGETVWKVAGRILNGVHQVAVVAKWGFCSPFLSFGGSLN
jgi:hypothetical protein